MNLIVGNRTEEQSRQASCKLVRHERQPLITFSQDFANQCIGGGVIPSNPTIRITKVPSPISKQSTYGALLCKVNGLELNRYPWLQQEKIPCTEPDHREKENDLRS